MPRPGPRPYECVRKAWHSDRHPPIRGSLIREIFRISNEVHSSTTRKNREWLEKLPDVVLKAEEIMYSKANTEAEYSDHQTLWDRLNDAIDTIIRRDESTESGQLLQPCIEAALILGCAPRRSSRSQRNESPRCYLKPQNTGACSVPHSSSPSEASGNYTKHTPVMLHSPQHLTHKTINSPSSFLKADNQSIRNRNQNEKRSPGLSKNCAPDTNQLASLETYAPPNTWCIYPLYYENRIQPTDVESTKPSKSCTRLMEFEKIGASDAPHFVSQSNGVSPSERKSNECDLTLRLGCTTVPCSSPGNAPSVDMDCSNSRTCVEVGFSRAVPTNDKMLRLPFGRFG